MSNWRGAETPGLRRLLPTNVSQPPKRSLTAEAIFLAATDTYSATNRDACRCRGKSIICGHGSMNPRAGSVPRYNQCRQEQLTRMASRSWSLTSWMLPFMVPGKRVLKIVERADTGPGRVLYELQARS